MEIHKFGGASINSIERIKDLVKIIKKQIPNKSIVIISAMGKITNQLESLVTAYYNKKTSVINKEFNKIKNYHINLVKELFKNDDVIFDELNNLFVELEWTLESPPRNDFDFEYDQIVSYGELLSTKIIAAFLQQNDINLKWLDARDVIKTDNTYRNANVDWAKTTKLTKRIIRNKLIVTQGFIGCTSENFNTTLGREGSDYTAAIFSNILNAKKTTIWKDVDGVFTADPSSFSNALLIKKLDYYDAIELAFYGAKVIHPKTIQPLKNKNIPLYVRSFLKTNNKGTIIQNYNQNLNKQCVIIKKNQFMISVSSRNFSFIEEDNISKIFSLFSKYDIKVNLMQNSSISFSVCVDGDSKKIPKLLSELKRDFNVKYNDNLELITIKNRKRTLQTPSLEKKEILLEQKSRKTVQYIVR